MINKEIEIKVLNINVEEVKQKLDNIGAVFISNNFQKIYTYDLFPISTTFSSIVETLRKNIGKKENILAIQKLIALLSDVSDLLKEDDKISLQINCAIQNFNEFVSTINIENVPSIIYDKFFISIISNYNTNPNKWVRLRESNNKVKIALKQIYNRKVVDGIRQHSINDVKEIEIEIDSIENGKLILAELGYYPKNYQEKKRISYRFTKNVYIDIDIWPHIPAYLEIEADNEELVYSVLTYLGYNKFDAKFLNADDVFTFYGLDMYSFQELKF